MQRYHFFHKNWDFQKKEKATSVFRSGFINQQFVRLAKKFSTYFLTAFLAGAACFLAAALGADLGAGF